MKKHNYVFYITAFKKSKAVPLHAMVVLGGEEI
jgi:hypothetical protein